MYKESCNVLLFFEKKIHNWCFVVISLNSQPYIMFHSSFRKKVGEYSAVESTGDSVLKESGS